MGRGYSFPSPSQMNNFYCCIRNERARKKLKTLKKKVFLRWWRSVLPELWVLRPLEFVEPALLVLLVRGDVTPT